MEWQENCSNNLNNLFEEIDKKQMPSNQSIDDQVGVLGDLFSSIATNIVALFGPLALSIFVWIMETWTAVLRQTTRSIQAVVESFKSDVIVFYQENDMFYPSVEKEHTLRKFMIGDAKWNYHVATKRFVNLGVADDECSEHSIGFLGASVSRIVDDSSHFLGDLSEWILDQTVWSNSEDVPFQVLVGAWAYCHGVSLHYNYPGHTFTVMTMDGDEQTFDLQTGQVQMDDLQLPPSNSSSDSESSLEEGEIRETDAKED